MADFTGDISQRNIYRIIEIDSISLTPLYLQIVNSILKGIEEGYLPIGYPLPSLNDLSHELNISRDTCVRVYNELKAIGIVSSVHGKGYFIRNADVHTHTNILLLFNKLSSYKKIIYDAFVNTVGNRAVIDFYIYNSDVNLFKEIFTRLKNDYSYYVILPHFIGDSEKAYQLIETIPKEKLILLDRLLPDISGEYSAVFEDFKIDIYKAMEEALGRLEKYHTIKIIFPEYAYFSTDIINGLNEFCVKYEFIFQVINDVNNLDLAEGEVYIVVNDDDLVTLINAIRNSKFKVGKKVGIISYNEIPFKSILLSGITTVSTDFYEMGRMTAELILTKTVKRIQIPFTLNLRDSL